VSDRGESSSNHRLACFTKHGPRLLPSQHTSFQNERQYVTDFKKKKKKKRRSEATCKTRSCDTIVDCYQCRPTGTTWCSTDEHDAGVPGGL